MSSNQSADYYDLTSATNASARLTQRSTVNRAPAITEVDPSPYVKFSAAGAARQPVVATPAIAAKEPDMRLAWNQSMEGPTGWLVLLERAQQVTEASGAFVVDPQGLVIATTGYTPGDGAEPIGARLAFAFEQADQMGVAGTLSRSIAIQLSDSWLSGLRIAVAGESKLVVGFSGKRPIPESILQPLAQIFARKALGA